MLEVLDTAFRDVAADRLCFRTESSAPARLPSLAVLRIAALGGDLELHLLGASHRVVLHTDRATVAELVACGVGQPGLPATHRRKVGPLLCRFQAHVRTRDTADEATRLRHRYGTDANALVGEFPGSSDALTVLAATVGPDRCAWRTWHVYPQSAQVVVTHTTVTVGTSA